MPQPVLNRAVLRRALWPLSLEKDALNLRRARPVGNIAESPGHHYPAGLRKRFSLQNGNMRQTPRIPPK